MLLSIFHERTSQICSTGITTEFKVTSKIPLSESKIMELTTSPLTSSTPKPECKDEKEWCTRAKPDCSIAYTKKNCRKYCNICKDTCQWSEWSEPNCSKSKCGPQYYNRRRYSLLNTKQCIPIEETALCPLMNCMGDNESTKNQSVVDIEVGNTTSLECSVNCGMGNITTIKVICNGTKLESEGSKGINLRIISANDCRTEISYTPCNGTDHDCPEDTNIENNYENTIWEQWSSCTQNCYSHNAAIPKRNRSGTTESGFVMRQDGVCEGGLPLCPFKCPEFKTNMYRS